MLLNKIKSMVVTVRCGGDGCLGGYAHHNLSAEVSGGRAVWVFERAGGCG